MKTLNLKKEKKCILSKVQDIMQPVSIESMNI